MEKTATPSCAVIYSTTIEKLKTIYRLIKSIHNLNLNFKWVENEEIL